MSTQAEPSEMTILVVDDDPAHLQITVRALRRFSSKATIIQALGITPALEALRCATTLSLCCIDLNLDGCSGIAVLDALRRERQFAKVPVIIVSTSDQEQEQAECRAHGASYFVHKADNPSRYQEALIDAVRVLINFKYG